MSKNKLEIISLNKPHILDFAMARNELFQNAKSDWVFFLDSDEIITEDLRKELISTSEVERPHFLAFYVKRKNYFLGKYVGTDKIVRFMKKGSGRWERKVHEIFRLTSGRPGELKYPIIHNTASTLHDFIAKINFYSTLHAEENLESGKRSSVLKIVFYPPAKFVESLIMGRGVAMSILQAFHSYLSWSKQWLIQKK